MTKPVGLWLDDQGQYHARLWFYGSLICGEGVTAVETLATCWQTWLDARNVSEGSRPQREAVSQGVKGPS